MSELRAQGYTFEAIREALAAVGVCVSNATVQREVARFAKCKPPVAARMAPPPAARSPAHPDLDSTPATGATWHQPADGEHSGKDLAAAFMKGRITNPLFRNRS
jgi:hypothetical protein